MPDIKGMRAFVRSFVPFIGSAVLLTCASPCAAAEEDPPSALSPPTHWVGVTPTWTHAFVGGSVSHEALGLALETFLGRRIGVALVSALYSPFSTEPPEGRSRETSVSLFPEVRIALLRGERGELALAFGAGAVGTRPVSRVDPAHRSFAYDARLAASGGAVARVFLQPGLALAFDVRDVTYNDVEENSVIAQARDDQATWFGDKVFVNAIEARLGLTMFLGAK